MAKLLQNIALCAVIIVLGYFLWDSIMKPIRFEKQKEWRYGQTVQSLKNIRDAQIAYKSVTGTYAGNFDTLENFIKNGELKIVKAIGDIPDSFFNQYPRKVAEQKAIEAGIVKRDTISIRCYDSLCNGKYNLADFRYVPCLAEKIPFELAMDTIENSSHMKIPVFEAKAHNNIYLKGLDPQEIINMTDEATTNGKYPGLKVGSVVEFNNNAGNWE